MMDSGRLRHLGGGTKGLFLLLRYLVIISASYLVLFESGTRAIPTELALMIAVALASNVALSFAPAARVLSWYVEAPVLVADTVWISWALHATGVTGHEFLLLYFLVLLLGVIGDNVALAVVASAIVGLANAYLIPTTEAWTAAHGLRLAFFGTVALFLGHTLSQIRRERQRADRGVSWAQEVEARVVERTEELRRAYHESLAANRLKSELVANMSHELRSPLHVVLGYTDILLDADDRPSRERSDQIVRRVRESARCLLQLVDGVLDLGRIESGQMPVAREAVPLERLMQEISQRERRTPAPGVTLEWRIGTLPLVETDPAKLGIVLDNLVGNAIRFTTAGWITVTVDDLPGEREVEFRIDDTGPGIPDAMLPTIFEPFRQLDAAEDIVGGGVGLGLAIVERYVALLGGRLDVRSKPGSGSTFTVTLPYSPRHAGAVPAVSERRVA